jgi:hypothetical protein
VIGDFAEDAHFGNFALAVGFAGFGAAERPTEALIVQAPNPIATNVRRNDREILMRSTPGRRVGAGVAGKRD